MFAHDFVRHAWLAGTAIALACGLSGYFVVLRGQVFAGDALSHVAFTGAVAAAAIGIDARLGLFVATMGAGALLAVLGRRAAVDDVAIGTAFAWILGLGVFFVALAATGPSGGSAISTAHTLFGSIFGLGAGAAWLGTGVGLAACVALLAIARPLLFSSVDATTARVAGVSVGLVGAVFLVVLGAVAAEATQAVGALLFLGLLAAPAGAATRLTLGPWAGMAVSGGLAVAAMWGGLAISYAVPSLPPSSVIVALAALPGVLLALGTVLGDVRIGLQQRVSG